MLIAEVIRIDEAGGALARPAGRNDDHDLEIVLLARERHGSRHSAPGVGERVLVRLENTDKTPVPGRILARVPNRPQNFVGVIAHRVGRGTWVQDCAPSGKNSFSRLRGNSADGLKNGDIVLVEGDGKGKEVSVQERIGHLADPAVIPTLVAARHELALSFGSEAKEEAAIAAAPSMEGREDLTNVPFVTIDGEDAKDFDDAVAATPNSDGGWRISVAIADVAHYVRQGSALDLEARERGNSTYLPGRVLPMLPEPLSNGWCSLVPGEPRGTVVAEIDIDSRGQLIDAKFRRALIRSRARLTYESVQAMADGKSGSSNEVENVLEPLYAAYQLLSAVREERGALEIELREHCASLDENGEVQKIVSTPRLDSHRLIEEFMILANVAAAQHLTKTGSPLLYRVHDEPRTVKENKLRSTLKALKIPSLRKGTLTTRDLNDILVQAKGSGAIDAIQLAVLRAQSQAEYSPHNVGHFGLALSCYAHFTSPIRRYADLVIHRNLLRSLDLEGGDAESTEDLEALGHHLSETERRSSNAEREVHQRYTCRLFEKEGRGPLDARIISVESFGMFVRVEGTDTEGLLHVSQLDGDFYVLNRNRQILQGERYGKTYGLGESIRVRIDDVDLVKGRISFFQDHEDQNE